jgi:isoleucyl-tRNA synthetase
LKNQSQLVSKKKILFKGFEVGNMSEENYDLVDLHKNVVDNIVLVSPSGKLMKRESDLIDVWFDSGAMPYAQWHYPFENKDLIDENKDFQQILLQKVLTKRVVGFILYTPSEL